MQKEVFCHRTKLYTVSTFITLFMLQNRLILTSLQLIELNMLYKWFAFCLMWIHLFCSNYKLGKLRYNIVFTSQGMKGPSSLLVYLSGYKLHNIDNIENLFYRNKCWPISTRLDMNYQWIKGMHFFNFLVCNSINDFF